ncbi:uncharacterized protein LOC131613405 [Vicia villosa]|uniref:uncharacterized protein LOC131613405 n=1 Tax=Vicia villosa TaxID=3911 RepID=UPI00273C273C|nr:uncharacterized protein LOC131613405 [Vicia villosa]
MVHPDNISRELVHLVDVSLNVEGMVVKAVDVSGDFNNRQEFYDRESMLTWICRNATNLGFDTVIGRSDNGTARRNAFVTTLCERSGKYHPPLRKFKRDGTGTRKYECLFKICSYMVASKKWRFSVICGLHNHDMCGKLQGYPSVCRLNPEEKTCINDMSLNLVQPKNILVTLKRKEPDNVSNIRWALEVCRSILKEQVEMPKASVTNRDIALMNAVEKVKPVVGTEQVETEGGKSVKPGVIVEQIMDAWTRIVNSSTKELYADSVIHFRKVYKKVESAHASLKFWLANSKGDLCRDWDTINLMIKNQHNEIQTTFGRSITVLEHRYRDNILYSQLIGNMSQARLNYIFHEVKLSVLIAQSVVALLLEREKSNISITSELEAIQERFLKADDNMKLHIKEQLQKIGYPETTDMNSQPVKTKGAPKKLKPTPNDNSTTRAPSYCEHVDKLFPDSSTPKSQKSPKSSNKGARI